MTRVAVLPYPPLLVPELTVRSDAEIEQLRSACLRAVSSLTQSSTKWVAVGVDRLGVRRINPDARGTFAGFGVDVPVHFGRGEGAADPLLPLPALVVGWLRAQARASEVTLHLLDPGTAPEECRDYGASLERESRAEPVAALVFVDGTNCRDDRSPSPPDDRAEAVDEQIRSALEHPDTGGLLALDPELLAAVGVEGRAALQVLAGITEATGRRWRGELLYTGTPFGVTYHVAVWAADES
jgi:aromatic ring-opening dioxygenase LigB subunit